MSSTFLVNTCPSLVATYFPHRHTYKPLLFRQLRAAAKALIRPQLENNQRFIHHHNRKQDPPGKKRSTNSFKLTKEIDDSKKPSQLGLKVISNGAYNTCKSVALHSGSLLCMFNCGDGIIRHFMQHRVRLSEVKHIFITHKSAQNLSGTLELAEDILRYHRNSKRRLNLHGYGSLECIANAPVRSFGRGKGDLTSLIRCSPDEVFKDHSLTAESVRLYDETDPTNDERAACAFKLIFKQRVEMVDKRQFGLKSGPWIRQLVDNEPVEVGGKLITPEMILEDAKPSKCTLVIDCPTMHHLASLTELKDKLCKREDNNFVDLVIHMTPDNIVQQPLYQQFISLFPSTTTQILLPEAEDITLRYPWEQQMLLNEVDTDMFPLLYPRPEKGANTKRTQMQNAGNVLQAQSGDFYDIVEGKFKNRDHLKSKFLFFPESQREKLSVEVKKRVSRTDHSMKREYPVVTMLGTGSTKSTESRNTAGILIETSENKFSMLDCGYGILGQLSVLYGPERTEHILRNLKMIFISHAHIDHHAGLLPLLCARTTAFGAEPVGRLRLLISGKLRMWTQHLGYHFEGMLKNVRILPNDHLCSELHKKVSKSLTMSEIRQVLSDLSLTSIETVTVDHARTDSCYGISLQHQDWKLVYSGDTMPCDSLIQAAKDADLLIHEATYGDKYYVDAEIQTHCTTSQALEVARRSNAQFTLLTHFKARHPLMPEYSKQLMEATNVGIALDNIILRPKDLPNTTMSSLQPVLTAMSPLRLSGAVHGQRNFDGPMTLNNLPVKSRRKSKS